MTFRERIERLEKWGKINTVLLVLASNIVSIVLAIGGVILALHDVEGWGWLIACSLLTAVIYTNKDKNKEL